MSVFLTDKSPFLLDDAGSASAAVAVGVTELGTGTGSAYVLPTPYAGAQITVFQSGSATAGKSVITDATSVTINSQGNRTVTLAGEGNYVSLVGKTTTRWQIVGTYNGAFS